MITSRFRSVAPVLLMLLGAASLSADVTLRYKSEFKMNSSLPAQLTQQAMAGMNGEFTPETVTRLHEGKGFSTAAGFTTIVDFTSKKLILLDTAGKRYAESTSDELADQLGAAMPEVPAEAKAAMSAFKMTVDSSKLTGRTAVILGIQAEEREIAISVSGPALMPNAPAGPMIRMVMLIWTAKDSEVLRVPALREMTGYNLWSIATMNPASMMEKVLKQTPGAADMVKTIFDELHNGKVLLRTHMEMYMPMFAAMMKSMPAGASSPFGEGFDANAPFMQMTQEAAELSSAPVAESYFQLPDGYEKAPAADVIKSMMSRMQKKM